MRTKSLANGLAALGRRSGGRQTAAFIGRDYLVGGALPGRRYVPFLGLNFFAPGVLALFFSANGFWRRRTCRAEATAVADLLVEERAGGGIIPAWRKNQLMKRGVRRAREPLSTGGRHDSKSSKCPIVTHRHL